MTIITKPDGVDAKSPKHFLFAPMPLWGHLRPNIALAANLLSRDPNLLVTFLVPALHAVPASKEFAKHKLLGNERFKIVEYGPRQFEEKAKEDPYMNAGQMVENAVKLPEYFKPIYAQLLTGEVIEDHSTGKPIYPFSAPPTVAIIDSSLCPRTYPVVDYFNNLLPDDKQKVKVVMIGATGSTHSAWYTLETLEEGRVQSYPSRCSKIMDSPPEEREHAYEKWLGSNADVVNLPDCAPIRDVFHPYVQYFLPLLPVVAAYVTIWPAFLGREYNERMVNSGKNVLQIGPQYSPLVEDATSLPTGVLKDFLDTALEEKGRNSVVYIR
uniref:Uncharacterized protein n=1 Tax=Kwoniella dejecticola CBS 10117 TaxID=1296121 RepID=A0A1A6A9W2_9TREE|nr:uncharacterized protein I303_02864 [Kwoniella dejecticola CBS 10117]OBR86845.1 hypothetical protein I303_02864 [Kwoniella dejecticola CBS 10117]